MTDSTLPMVLTVPEVAKLLSLSERTIWNYIKDTTIPSVKIGGAVRIPRAALEEMINGGLKKKQ